MERSFHHLFVEVFDANFQRVFRYIDRQSGDAELAADVAQDAFVRLYRRGSLPDSPEAWLISVAANLFRNARSKSSRRARLLTVARGSDVLADASPNPHETLESRESAARVRSALDRLPDRDRQLLLLRAEGYGYREMAIAMEIRESSVGTLLARAKRAFLEIYAEPFDAP